MGDGPVVNFGDVVARQPEAACVCRVPRQDHDPFARYPQKLAKSSSNIAPVVDRGDRESRIYRVIPQGQQLRAPLVRGRSVRKSLVDHFHGWFDGDYVTIARLIRSGTRPNIHYRGGIAQCVPKSSLDSWIRRPRDGIRLADRVVARDPETISQRLLL
jgi:hypothetical protein